MSWNQRKSTLICIYHHLQERSQRFLDCSGKPYIGVLQCAKFQLKRSFLARYRKSSDFAKIRASTALSHFYFPLAKGFVVSHINNVRCSQSILSLSNSCLHTDTCILRADCTDIIGIFIPFCAHIPHTQQRVSRHTVSTTTAIPTLSPTTPTADPTAHSNLRSNLRSIVCSTHQKTSHCPHSEPKWSPIRFPHNSSRERISRMTPPPIERGRSQLSRGTRINQIQQSDDELRAKRVRKKCVRISRGQFLAISIRP